MGSNRPHWLQVAGRTSTPQVVVSFDTETLTEHRDGAEILRLRCWDAITRQRAASTGHDDLIVSLAGETPLELAQALAAATALTGEAWCFAHNAGFDLTVTSLPMVLTGLGWEPGFVNIGEETCVFVMRQTQEFCTRWTRASPNIKTVRVDWSARTVEAQSVLFFSARAHYVDAHRGCVIE